MDQLASHGPAKIVISADGLLERRLWPSLSSQPRFLWTFSIPGATSLS